MNRFFHTTFLCVFALGLGAFHVHASIADRVNEIRLQVETASPMPIGAAIDELETLLLSDTLKVDEKRAVAALYVRYQLLIHQRPDENVLRELQGLEDNSKDGLIIAAGIARMYGISANYTEAYNRFDAIISAPSIPADVKAYALIYQILTYSEGQVFAPNAELINTVNDLLITHDLSRLRPLYDSIVADYYQSVSAFDLALRFYEKSLKGAQAANQRILESDNLYAIGILYRNLGNYDKAIIYLERAVEHDKEIDINYSEFLAIYGIATTYYRAGDLKSAIALSEKVLTHPLSSSFYNSEIYRLKAEAHLTLGELDEAHQSLELARQLYDENREDEQTTWRAQLEKTAAYITAARGNYKLAFEQFEVFHEAYLQAKKYEDLELIESANLVQQIT